MADPVFLKSCLFGDEGSWLGEGVVSRSDKGRLGEGTEFALKAGRRHRAAYFPARFDDGERATDASLVNTRNVKVSWR